MINKFLLTSLKSAALLSFHIFPIMDLIVSLLTDYSMQRLPKRLCHSLILSCSGISHLATIIFFSLSNSRSWPHFFLLEFNPFHRGRVSIFLHSSNPFNPLTSWGRYKDTILSPLRLRERTQRKTFR